MKIRAMLFGWTIAVALASESGGQVPVINSIRGSGRLSWTNAVNTNAVYRIEWASQAGGPWRRFTPQSLNTIDASTNREFTVEIPMFYRVVMETNPPPIGMVWIEGGSFQMGGDSYGSDALIHKVAVGSFWMDVFEVTMGQWKEVYDWAVANGYDFDNPGTSRNGIGLFSPAQVITNLPCYPVHSINWFDAIKWCNARSEMEGLTANYAYVLGPSILTYKTGQRSNLVWRGTGYRLPTEAEWEYAARGGRQGRRFPWGDTISHKWANYSANPGLYSFDVNPYSDGHRWFYSHAQYVSQPGAGLPPNGYGLFDMAGNVREWCWDWYGPYLPDDQVNPTGPAMGTNRVVRGGQWNMDARSAQVSDRFGPKNPDSTTPFTGFRCVRGP